MLAPSTGYTISKAYTSPETFIKSSLETPSVVAPAGAVTKIITKNITTGTLKTLAVGGGALLLGTLLGGGGQEQKQQAEQEAPIIQQPTATQDNLQRTKQLMRTIIRGRQRYQAEAKQETDISSDILSQPSYKDISAGGNIYFGGSPVYNIPTATPNIQQSPTFDLSPITGAVAENRNLLDQLTGALSQPSIAQGQEATKTTDWGMLALIGGAVLGLYLIFGRKKK